MKNILMSAFIGSSNLGDEAIFHSLLQHVRRKDRSITALAANVSKAEKTGVRSVHSNSVRNLRREIKNCDVMLLGGGGIIQDQSSILNLFYYAFQLLLARYYKKPVILNFVGVGPIRFRLSRAAMRWLIPSIYFAIVRDKQSSDLLIEFLPKNKVHQAYDPVLSLPYNRVETNKVSVRSTPYVLVSLRMWFFVKSILPASFARKINKLSIFNRKYLTFVRRIARDLDLYLDAHDNINLVLCPMYVGEDNRVNSDVFELMQNSARVQVIEKELNESEFLSLADRAEFIIGMRLHSLILGAIISKPFVALRYSSKVDEFTSQMGLFEHSINIEEYDSDKLQESLDYVDSHGKDFEKMISQAVEKYKRENEKAFSLLNQKIDEI